MKPASTFVKGRGMYFPEMQNLISHNQNTTFAPTNGAFYLHICLIDSTILSQNSSQFLMFQSGCCISGNQALALVIIYLAYVAVIAVSFQGRLGCSYVCKKCYFNNVNFVLNDCASIKSHIVINLLPCS